MTKINPFITSGYISAKYFCDRITETTTLTRYITNGNNVALISPRRLGKTGLIEHCFHQQQIREVYHTFLIDIYATKNFQEFVFELEIMEFQMLCLSLGIYCSIYHHRER